MKVLLASVSEGLFILVQRKVTSARSCACAASCGMLAAALKLFLRGGPTNGWAICSHPSLSGVVSAKNHLRRIYPAASAAGCKLQNPSWTVRAGLLKHQKAGYCPSQCRLPLNGIRSWGGGRERCGLSRGLDSPARSATARTGGNGAQAVRVPLGPAVLRWRGLRGSVRCPRRAGLHARLSQHTHSPPHGGRGRETVPPPRGPRPGSGGSALGRV